MGNKKNKVKGLIRDGITDTSKLSELTGVSKRHCRRAKQEMRESGEIEDDENGKINDGNFFFKKTDDGAVASIPVDDMDATLEEAFENPKFKNIIDSGIIDIGNYYIDKFVMGDNDVTLSGGNKHTNYYMKIWWKLKDPDLMQLALKGIEESIESYEFPKIKRTERDGDYMVEIGLYDIHFGMQAWKEESGENYDLKIARHVYMDAMYQIVDRVSDMDVDYFLLPIGNDFLHINDITNKTPRAKNELYVDTRLPKIIVEAENTLRDAVNLLRDIAPVRIIWVPGNHDPQTSFYLLRVINALFMYDERVDVDVDNRLPRKYEKYGINLIGFLHYLTKSREKLLPNIMADEAADLWEPNQYREIHTGHTHKKRELHFQGVDTYGGVVMRVIPSLVATNLWHFEQGYVGTSKTAQMFIWNKNYGLESVHDIHVDKDEVYC